MDTTTTAAKTSVWCWGVNKEAQCGHPTTKTRLAIPEPVAPKLWKSHQPIVQVAAGGLFSAVLTGDTYQSDA